MSSSFSFSIDSEASGVAAVATAAKLDAAATPRTVASEYSSDKEESGEEAMPWEEYDWVPTTKSGKQKTPNQIRNEFQRYLDDCGRTQGAVLAEIGVNSNSFRRFMDPGNYKGQWSAVQNGTYFAAARLLAKHEHEKKLRKAQGNKKRKSAAAKNDDNGDGSSNKKQKVSAAAGRDQAEAWMIEVLSTTGANTDVVYDSCPEIVKKIKKVLKDQPGLTKASFCRIALEGANNNSLGRFLAAKHQDQQGNAVYRKAYAFFEKLRLKNGEPKSKARLKHEEEKGADGFDTCPKRKNAWGYIMTNASYNWMKSL